MRESYKSFHSPCRPEKRSHNVWENQGYTVKLSDSFGGWSKSNFSTFRLARVSLYRLKIHDAEGETQSPTALIDECPAESSTRDTCNSCLTSGTPRYFIRERASERANERSLRERRDATVPPLEVPLSGGGGGCCR